MEKLSCIVVLVSLFFVATLCSDAGPTKCSTGSKCFPYGPVPKDVTDQDILYYCCMESNRRKHIYRPPGASSYNCSCILDLSLEAKAQKAAQDTRHLGRMCVREGDCEGSVFYVISDKRYKFCCFLDTVNSSLGSHTHTISKSLDSDKDEFDICRCANTQVPTPDPKAYVVPPVPRFNSTGEVCSYDEGCKNRPTLKCQSHVRKNVTFCCYGSRGLVTQNDGNNFTRCTCTDEVFGARCAALPIAIEDTTMPCLTDPGSIDNVNCNGTGQAKRCCAYNMLPEVTSQSNDISSCTCQVPTFGKPDDTSEGTRQGSRLNGVILCALVTLLFKHM